MRLAVCTVSAVLLSGCSWLGYGGGGASYGGGSSYGAGCANTGAYGGQYAYGSQYSQAGYAGGAGGCGPAYGAGGGYGMAGYGQGNGMGGGYGANGYGVGTGALGLRGAQGAGAYGAGYGMNGATAYGPGAGAGGAYGTAGGGQFINGQWVAGAVGGAGTVLGGAAPYGAAAGGQFINGQWAAGGTQVAGGYGYGTSGSVTTVQGAPIYVPQPYPAYYGVAAGGGGYSYGGGYAYGGGLRGGSAALPFGIEAGIGTDIAIGGDIVGAKPAGPALNCCGGPGNLDVSATPAISYGDAYKNAVSYDLAATYDVDPSMTLIGRIGYSNAEGQRINIGTIDDRQINPAPNTTTEDLYAQWSDLEQFTLEGGVRKYMGGWNNRMSGIRPYVGATAGFTHNNAVTLAQESATLMPTGSNVQQYIDAGWTPTASGIIGAEMQVGARTAIGVEAGLRWSDDLNTNFESDDRWSVPVKLRGRVSF